MALSTFRRNTKTETKKTGGKGFRGNWRERFRLPKNQPAAFVLQTSEFIDPNPAPEQIEIGPDGKPMPVKVEYFKFRRHKRKLMGPGGERYLEETCSRGWDSHNPQPCVGCYAMDSGATKDKSVGLSDMVAIGLIHLAYYHRHPLIDPKKGLIMKKDNSGPFYTESECTGKACNFCRILQGQQPILQPKEWFPQYDPATIQTVYGGRRYMELGKGHLADLGEWDKQIGMRCGGVAYVKDPQGNYVRDQTGNAIPKGRCNNFLTIDSYNCSQCGNVLIDAATDPRPPQALEEVALQKYPCHHCQRQVQLKEIDSCDSCGAAVVQGIFDGVLWGVRQGEGTQSHLVLAQFDSFADFEANLPQHTRDILGKPLKDRIEELNQPYNFEELFKPKSLQEQSQRLELPLPPGYGAAPQQSYPQGGQPQGYGAPQQQFYGAQPQQQAPSAPAYQPYGTLPQGPNPGPAPFVPPPKPNFGT